MRKKKPPVRPAETVGSIVNEPILPVGLFFTLIISKLDVPEDIYNLMSCNSAMKNVFFSNIGDSGNAYLQLLIQFAFPQAKQFQKSLTNSEYYALLNQPDEQPYIDWSHAIEIIFKDDDSEEVIAVEFEAFNFQQTSPKDISYQIKGSFTKGNSSTRIKEMPKIVSFLLLNEISTDPQSPALTVNHLRWLVEDWGFKYTPIIKEQILRSFDLAKITYCFPSGDIKEFITPELLSFLYTGGTGGAGSADTADTRKMSSEEKLNFIRYFYQSLDGLLPADILSNGDYVDFSYDALNELVSSALKSANLLSAFIDRKPEARNILPIIQWLIKNKIKISTTIVSYIFDIAVYPLIFSEYRQIPWEYQSKHKPINENPLSAGVSGVVGNTEYYEAFKILLLNGYLPEKYSYMKIVTYGNEEIWNLLYEHNKYYFYPGKDIYPPMISLRNRENFNTWLKEHDM